MKLDAPGLENEIVRMTPFLAEHRHLLRDTEAVEAMWRWMPAIPKGHNVERYMDMILKAYELERVIPFTIFSKPDNAFVGVAGFVNLRPTHRSVRIGYAWHPPECFGSMVYPSVQMLMIQRAYDWYAKRLTWHVDPRNEAALRAMAFIEATEEATLRQYMRTAGGEIADVKVFAMVRSEMPIAVERLDQIIKATLT